MGMFGMLGRALSNPDALSTIGATLKDVGAGLNGQDGNAVAQLREAMQARKAQEAKQAFAAKLSGLIGGSYDPNVQVVANSPDASTPTPPICQAWCSTLRKPATIWTAF
jgi:vacuolar-type H+-ATPase subunit E/Vma4